MSGTTSMDYAGSPLSIECPYCNAPALCACQWGENELNPRDASKFHISRIMEHNRCLQWLPDLLEILNSVFSEVVRLDIKPVSPGGKVHLDLGARYKGKSLWISRIIGAEFLEGIKDENARAYLKMIFTRDAEYVIEKGEL